MECSRILKLGTCSSRSHLLSFVSILSRVIPYRLWSCTGTCCNLKFNFHKHLLIMCHFKKVFRSIVIFLITCYLSPVLCVSLDKDLTITASQKRTLDKFRKNVETHLPHNYMKEDIYLVRWLRARNFNLEAAENMLNSNLEWRRKQKMDTILGEDWTEMRERYKYYDHAFDKKGQPVAYFAIGQWDVRRATILGENEKLSRYLESAMEEVCNKPRLLRAQNKTVTQVDLVVDLGGFSLTQQGCLPCIPFYIRFVLSYENYYPGCADTLILINTPAAFEIILTAIRPLFSQLTRDALQVYGTNKNMWQPILFSYFDKNQLPPELGGTDGNGYDEE